MMQIFWIVSKKNSNGSNMVDVVLYANEKEVGRFTTEFNVYF